MRVYGTGAMSDLLGELIVYRSLRPADARLPSLAAIRPGPPPRKGQPAYAAVVAELLRAARRLRGPGEIRRFIVLGDTRRSDGGALETLAAATGWRGRGFICDEDGGPPRVRREGGADYANAWSALHAFRAALEAEEFPVDSGTAVLVDIDKTLIGARGRNHHLIDRARLAALRTAVAAVLAASFDPAAFEATYRELDQPAFHPLTEDNQDFVAYLCVMVGGGVLAPGEPARLLAEGHAFRDALDLAGDRVLHGSPALAPFHDEIARLVIAGDPTPFKSFRRREYAETVALMGRPELSGEADAARLLAEEVVITGEVWEVAQGWGRAGALLLGLSDKPDEAAVPPPEEARAGARPLHRIPTHIVGS